MKVIVSKSKEYKNFTDLFYKNKDAKSFKIALSKVYNNTTFQSGYIDMPDDYIQSIPDIFDCNTDIIDPELTKAYTEVELSPTADFRKKSIKVLSDNTMILDNAAYSFREASPEILYGLGYFEPDTVLENNSTKNPEDIDPVQIVSPAPLFVNYKQTLVDGDVKDTHQYQVFVNGPLTAVVNRNAAIDDTTSDAEYYLKRIKEVDEGTGPDYGISNKFIWAKNTKLDTVDVSKIPFNPKYKIDHLDLYKVEELRAANVHQYNSYYAVKDATTDEVYKYITNEGKEYLGPDITITEHIYSNTKIGTKAQVYDLSVKVGTKELGTKALKEDIVIFDELKNKILEKRKKYGELTVDDAVKSYDVENVNQTALTASIYSGFSSDSITEDTIGNKYYNLNIVGQECIESMMMSSLIVIGKKLYNVVGCEEVQREYELNFALASRFDVPGGFRLYKIPTIADSAVPMTIKSVVKDVSGDTVDLEILFDKSTYVSLKLKLDPNTTIDANSNNIYDIMDTKGVTSILELEVDGDNSSCDLVENEYHICSAITLHKPLTIAGKEGTADISSTIAVRSLDGKNFNNDGTLIVENIQLDKSAPVPDENLPTTEEPSDPITLNPEDVIVTVEKENV